MSFKMMCNGSSGFHIVLRALTWSMELTFGLLVQDFSPRLYFPLGKKGRERTVKSKGNAEMSLIHANTVRDLNLGKKKMRRLKRFREVVLQKLLLLLQLK